MSASALHSSVERYFKVSLFLLITCGFLALASTGKLDFPSLAFVSLALLVRAVLLVRRGDAKIPERWASYVTLAYAAFYAADYFLLSGQNFVSATIHLVLFAMVVKLFSVYRTRDYVYLAVLAFLQVLAASVLTVDTTFVVVFILFVVLAVSTFISFEMYRSSTAAQVQVRGSTAAARQLPRTLPLMTMLLVGGIVAGAVAIFFLLPRMAAGYLSAFAPHSEIVSGFSNEVNLGRIGQIQQLNTVVMHVEFYGSGNNIPDDIKFRGISLSLFDGKRWSNPPRDQGEGMLLTPSYGRYNLRPLYQRSNDVIFSPRSGHPLQSLRYRVLMEPMLTPVFFVVPKVEVLQGGYAVVVVDSSGSLINNDADRHVISSYEAVSQTEQPPPELLRAAKGGIPPGIQLRYLQLPRRLDPRVRSLAERVTAGLPAAYDKAVAIEAYLKNNYGYTLQLPAAVPDDPIASFLFQRKQGHCEYFASSMAVMLRTLGLPARVVNGFRGGEFNDLTGSYIVRARDAHSWVEVWFPQYGWISFDPTPPDPHYASSAWNRVLLYIDAGREFWREWIVNYDFSHQRTLTATAVTRGGLGAASARQWLGRQFERLRRLASAATARASAAPARWTTGVVVVIALALVALNARRLRRTLRELRLARRPEQAPSSAAGVWYARLVKLLARRGWRKAPAQTPQEFAAAIEDLQLRHLVAEFTATYERARFGDSAADAAALPELYRRVRTT